MLIAVLGGGIDLNGNLPSYVYQRLDRAIELYKKSVSQPTKIVTSGKYSFLYKEQKPPLTESEKMADYLLKKDLPKKDIYIEKQSKDSIGNAYYLKKSVFIPNKECRAVIITSHFHLERVKYIFNKIFGSKYELSFVGVMEKLSKDEEDKVIARQKDLLNKMRKILSPMKDGDHDFLKGKLYKIKYYKEKRPNWVINFVAKGK